MPQILVALAAVAVMSGSSAADAQWEKVSISRSCEAMVPAYCQAHYGFSVDRSGHFVAGPNASGKTIEGSLSAGEAAQVQADVRAAVNGKGACERSESSVRGSSTSLILTMGDHSERSYVISGFAEPGACSPAGASKLFSDLDALAAKYSPVPF